MRSSTHVLNRGSDTLSTSEGLGVKSDGVHSCQNPLVLDGARILQKKTKHWSQVYVLAVHEHCEILISIAHKNVYLICEFLSVKGGKPFLKLLFAIHWLCWPVCSWRTNTAFKRLNWNCRRWILMIKCNLCMYQIRTYDSLSIYTKPSSSDLVKSTIRACSKCLVYKWRWHWV